MSELDDDDKLLDMLGNSLTWHDAVPEAMTRFARESHRLLSFEHELAEIVADSALDVSTSRSATDLRIVRLEIGDHEVELEISDDTVMGSVAPAPPDRIELESGDQTRIDVPVNDRGFFRFDSPSGAYRLWLHFDGRLVRTNWLS